MEKTLKFKDGRKYTVKEETGKYYICKKGLQFRKSDPIIESVIEKEEKPKEEEWVDIPEEKFIIEKEEEKPLKRTARKTTKKESKKGE